MNKPDKLNKFLVKELKSDLKDILILNTSDGGYIVFNKYTILEKQGLFEVKSTDSYAVFSSIKLALCYCVYHNIFELSSATRLKNLDEEIQYIKNNKMSTYYRESFEYPPIHIFLDLLMVLIL